uniref:Putative conserved secreted protein n=1 Tax=Xenopsylla cheopis TaxID=163159 RepID=A0A6M2DVU4_XENCH
MLSTRRNFCLVLLALTCLASFVAGRPQHSLSAAYDSSAQGENSLDSNEIRRYYQSAEDPTLANLQMQLLAQQYAAANRLEGLPWEQLLRVPETKRQVRYRQCYFNPISCFRK